MTKTIYVNRGTANTFTDGNTNWIELHKAVKKYPALHAWMLAHERGHIKEGGKMDFMYEIQHQSLMTPEVSKEFLQFRLKNPSWLWQLLPLYKASNGKYYFDYLVSCFWLGFVFFIGIFYWLLF